MAKEKTSKQENLFRKLLQVKDVLTGIEYKKFLKQGIDYTEVFIKDVRFKLKDLNTTNYELGVFHYNHGNIADARFRFWFYSIFWPGRPEVDYFLGRAHFELGNAEKSIPYLEKYQQANHQAYIIECNYTLQVAKKQVSSIAEIPLTIIKHNYDCIAEKYNASLLENIEDTPQKKMCADLEIFLNEKGKPYGNRLLDLGSGTGIVGKLLKEAKAVGFATGVDISTRMCKIAAALKIDNNLVYNQILNLSLQEYLMPSSNSHFDLIVMSGLLESFANPSDILTKITQTASTDAVLVVLFKISEGEENYIFSSEREEFLHNPEMLKTGLSDLGWKLYKECDAAYFDGDKGKYFILTR